MDAPSHSGRRLPNDWILPLAIVVGLVLLLGLWFWIRNRPDSFPPPSQIAEITIPIQSPLKADESVSSIRVPESEFDRLHSLFQESHVDRNPAKWPLFYRLNLTLENGEPMSVSVWFTNDDAGAFRVNRTYYRGGSDAAFEEFLRAILPDGVEILE